LNFTSREVFFVSVEMNLISAVLILYSGEINLKTVVFFFVSAEVFFVSGEVFLVSAVLIDVTAVPFWHT
jgi:hypothetical protein